MLEEIKSPCIGVCAINDLSGLCYGCHRTLDEIKGWWDMRPSEQKSLLSQLAERQLQHAAFGD
ncbi:MAG: DUF1289 domain-containing protein [Methylotenera sp.]|nr:DUF1289 domain-containing protein [Methylotenera sp.]